MVGVEGFSKLKRFSTIEHISIKYAILTRHISNEILYKSYRDPYMHV